MNKQEIKAAIVLLAEYLQTSISDEQIIMYANDLSDLSSEQLGTAIKRLKMSGDNYYGKFPLPANIRAYINGNNDGYALETSLKIMKAVAMFGWPSPKEAKEFIGELGWSIVNAYGGWQTVCKMIDGPEKLGIYQSQFTKTATMMLERSSISERDGGSLLTSDFERTFRERTGIQEPITIRSLLDGFKKESTDQAC